MTKLPTMDRTDQATIRAYLVNTTLTVSAREVAAGAISSTVGMAVVAAIGIGIPWLHVTWAFAAVMIPVNTVIGTALLARRRRDAERLRLAPARLVEP
jgi:hypothetical protein